MTFNQLISMYDWEDIQDSLLSLYPDERKNISGYKGALLELRFTIPTGSDFTLYIERVDEEDESYEDVYTRHFMLFDTKYGLDFVSWADVLSMEIDSGVFNHYPDLEIICHILFEITFYGYSSAKIEAEGSKLKDIVREIRDVE